MAHSRPIRPKNDDGDSESPDRLISLTDLADASLDIEQVRTILPQLIDALADAVLVVDRERRVVAANRRYLETFGMDRTDVVGVHCHDSVGCPASGGDDEGCAACDVMNLGEPQKLIRSIPDVHGVLKRWEASLNPVNNELGQVTHVVEVWRDITDRSRLESQLSHSERLASLGMLAAGVAHEVNNPLASILAGVESLKRWLNRAEGLNEEQREEASEVLDVLELETQRSRETTDKLLLLGQPIQNSPNWVDVNSAITDTFTLLGYQMKRQGVRPALQLAESLPLIWARGSGIRGVLMNLCMNAVQAMPEGGTLIARSRADGHSVVFEIEDSGPGIAPEHLQKIWNPFFTTKPVGQGTGLGLSITQRIISDHRGEVFAENLTGRGARFIVRLPVSGPGGVHA